MKNLIILSLFLFSFVLTEAQTAQDLRKPGHFTQLRVYGRFDVVLVQGGEESIKVEAAQEHLQNVLTDVESGMLKVRMKTNYYKDANIKLVITYKQLDRLEASAGAIIDAGTLESKKFFFQVGTGAEVKSEVISDSLTTQVTKGGILTLSGKATYYDVQVGTGGQLTAYLLNAATAKARVNMGGYAKITVKEKLDAAVNMGGNISFKGEPKEVKQATNMGGSITQIRE